MKIKLSGFLIIALLSACSYKFNGASTEGLKTVNIRPFENNAPLVVPTLSNQLTESIKTRIRTQTRLNLTQSEGDAIFEGRITGYDIRPVSLQANATPTAGAQRVTITVSVKYTNTLDVKKSFEESMSRFFESSLTGKALEAAAIENINKQLTEDIFNRAFAQW